MEKNKIFIVIDNIELRDGDKVKGFCGLFFDAEESLRFVIDNQKKSKNLEVITYDIPECYEIQPKDGPISEPFKLPDQVIPPNNPYHFYPYIGDVYPYNLAPQYWPYKTYTTTGGTGDVNVIPTGETNCTIQFSKNK